MIGSASTLLSLHVPFLPARPSPHLDCELHEGVDSEEFSSVSSQFDKYVNESTSSRFRVFSKLERVLGAGLEQQILRKLITEGTVFPNGRREESLGHPLAHFHSAMEPRSFRACDFRSQQDSA